MKIRPVGAELFRKDGRQAGRHGKVKSVFVILRTRLKTEGSSSCSRSYNYTVICVNRIQLVHTPRIPQRHWFRNVLHESQGVRNQLQGDL
jgi:hypothetical protein